MKKSNQIIFQYSNPIGQINQESNPNGSILNIAGICNKNGNVLGLMPHPERVSEHMLGGIDGKKIFNSIIRHFSA